MSERSNGKTAASGSTLNLMEEDEPVKARASRKAAAPAAVPSPAPVEAGGALFGGDEVDTDAKHPADVPVGSFPAPSQIAQVEEMSADPFGEDDPFEDTVMARMLADEPAPILSPLRAAREELNQDLNLAMTEEPELAAAAVIEPPVEQKAEQKETPMPAAIQPAPAAKAPTSKKKAPGLTIPRRYTQPGQDVWKTAEWELRTASIVGSDGTVVFEQKGVEIPKSWSQLATNVVVSKYFRGQIGTLEREYSVKQLIGRVSDRILGWGKDGGYFATDADAEAFHDELRYILLHQFAAFNSPVWFNLGWAGRRQAVSACLPYDVRVNTDRGLLPIGEIVRLFQSTPNPQISTYAPDGTPSRIVAAICNGRRRVINFHLADGSTLRCTSNHRVFVRASKGEVAEKEAGDLIVGVDRLILNRSVLLPETTDLNLNFLTPDADLAWLTGLMVGDGYCGRSETLTSDTWDLKINTLPEKERVEAILTKYGVPFRIHLKSWGFCLRGHGAVSRAFWSALGLWGRVGDKQVPEWIYRTSAENVGAFLGGLFDADGHVTENGSRRLPVFSNTSLPLMQATQSLLRSLGIYASLTAYTDSRDDYARKTSYSLGIHDNISVEQFEEVIGFTHAHKQARMTERLIETASSLRSADVLVVSKTLGGPEYVYDIQTESETFWAEGILLHNCYINEVNDTMESILDLYKTEGMLFKDGSGSGLNLSTLRSSKEPLEAGGRSSGPISFMKGLDASAGSIKSGGSCLAPWTRVYTENGPIPVSQLVGKDFVVLSYDPPAGRYKAKRAQAWHAGTKRVVRLTTDKGQFDLSYDHPVRLADGRYAVCEQLRPGQPLFHCKVDEQMGYVRVGLRRGRRSSEQHRKLHQLIAEDVLGWDLHGKSLHHRDENKHNNDLTNLSLMAQADHASLHSLRQVVEGSHIFQNQRFSLTGQDNGMAAGSAFWQDAGKADRYRKIQGDVLRESGRAPKMHSDAMRAKMLNKAYAVLSEGLSVDTPEDYFHGCIQIGRRCPSKAQFLDAVQNNFGGYEAFLAELKVHNHRVISVETLGIMDVYDVEVDCPTADDKSPQTGHNFVIWSDDSRFGTGIAVANTRRAACMRVLDIDHPDIKDFIDCKKDAEEKAHALIDAGYSGAFNVPNGAYDTVPFQNANHSVRVTDAFMQAVEADALWDTKFRMSGKTAETVRARDLMRGIAEGTWVCGDPGMQYDTTINDWHTCAATDRIYASNPCSEYMFLNSTACNLSSLNLMKFRQAGTGAFDVDSFDHAVRMMITAQEIVVGFAHYPTPKIEQRSHEYRTLGLGYANLGALLMAAGLPYDSDAGRSYAGAVTALMTGRAYHQSALIARDCGEPFSGFAENRDPMLRVMRKHRESVDTINGALIPDTLLTAARQAWDEAVTEGQASGYRNAQATVLAPTGTIGFLMDCDTTGIEPDIAIVKYKSLVGGGMMKIVNQTVPEALQRLGYSEGEVAGIVGFIDEHDTIEGAPDLKSEHLPIFDCAFRPMNGTRSIHYRGHIKMMAAAQPFISGAISKTCNVPNDATPEEIAEVYLDAWKLGLKAVAIYRDGSKRTQPLNTSKEAPAADKAGAGVSVSEQPMAALTPPKAVRRRLPDERAGVTHKFSIGGHEGYLTVGLYPDTNQPGEIFIRMSKEGSSISGLMDSFATAISLALQYGVPLQTLVDKFIHSRFEPSGFTGNKDIPMAKSVMDYIFRYLALRFLQKEDRHNVGLLADQDDAYAVPAKLPAPPPAPEPAHDVKSGSLSSGGNGHKNGSGGELAHLAEANTATITEHEREIYRMQSDAPPCPECGAITIRSGACYKCLSCGTSLGCS